MPTRCVYPDCNGRKFHLRQQVSKPLRDTVYQQVQVPRYQCLRCIGVSSQQAASDLTRLGKLVKSRKREQAAELEALHRRYLQACPPREGEHQSLAYRLRLLFLDRWNVWHRLTRYRNWKGPQGETLDGTNNASKRVIGWWIKERYHSMRGYKVPENAVRVSRLLAWCGNFLNCQEGAVLAGLLQ